MSSFITPINYKKLERFFRKILEKGNVKNNVYKILIIPTQKIAIKKIERQIKKTPNLKIKAKSNSKKIIFNSVDARHMTHTYLEGAISKSLQLRGHETKMIICGGALNMCTTFHRIDHPPNQWSCKNCINFSKKFYETVRLEYYTYLDFITKKRIEEISEKIKKLSIEECKDYKFNDISVGKHAITSAERYFKGYVFSKKLYNKILRDELINAIITTHVAKGVIKKEKPDVLVTSHGCYSSWGSFSDYFVNKGIRICVWASGEGNTLTFDRQKSDEYYLIYLNEIRKKRNLNEKEKEELFSFLDKRTKGEHGQVSLYDFTEIKKEKLEKIFDFNRYDKTYVIFPNVPWDAALMNADVGFNNIYDWLYYTINLFQDKTNFQLIIKIHPSEVKVMESKKTVLDYLEEKFTDLSENIKIISSDTMISPYSLFPFIDLGLVYNGTVGLEMAIKGLPVIVAGNAHYGKKGFTYDILTKNEYSKILFSEISPFKDQKKLASIYAYFHFIKKFIPKSFIYNKNFLKIGWNINSLIDLTEGNDRNLDHICNYIVNNGVFQNW